MTVICYRCGATPPCTWDDGKKEITTYPRSIDIPQPSCPDDAPMPDEFKDSYQGGPGDGK